MTGEVCDTLQESHPGLGRMVGEPLKDQLRSNCGRKGSQRVVANFPDSCWEKCDMLRILLHLSPSFTTPPTLA